jgi:pilus assembly protein CpaE
MQASRGLIISDNSTLVYELEDLLLELRPSLCMKQISIRMDDPALHLAAISFAPSIAFVDLTDLARGTEIAARLEASAPHIYLIGMDREAKPESLLRALRAGIRDIVEYPFTPSRLNEALEHGMAALEDAKNRADQEQMILSFLPAKVGSGASTVALNTAYAIARTGKVRTALMDLDFEAGIIDFMLRLPEDHGLTEIVEFETRIDDSIWSRFVNRLGDLDVLRAGTSESTTKLTAATMERILGFARGKYAAICVDLPGVISEAARTVLENSDHIFLVCTAELPSIHLAKRRLAKLREMKLEGRVRIVYNRCRPGASLSKSELEDLLDDRVFVTIDNDYGAVQTALMNGESLDRTSAIGRAFAGLAATLLGDDPAAAKADPAAREQGVWNRLVRLFLAAPKPADTPAVPPRLMLTAPQQPETEPVGRLCLPAPSESPTAPATNGIWIAATEPVQAASDVTIEYAPVANCGDLQRLGVELARRSSSRKHHSRKKSRKAQAAPKDHSVIIG